MSKKAVMTTSCSDDFPDWDEEEPEPDDPAPEEDIEPPRGFTPPPASSAEEDPSSTASTSDAAWNPSESGGFFNPDSEYNVCEECERPFIDSWLRKNFECKVCDDCRDRDGKHSLVTKTDARNEYLLKDEDFDKREPALKCIVKKNPHNANWGDMKLFLRSQVEDRALEVWGTEEALDAERDKRQNRKEKSKKRTFDKMIKELRMNARSSLGKNIHTNHEHIFGEEDYDEESDMYKKKCQKCDHVMEYEKM